MVLNTDRRNFLYRKEEVRCGRVCPGFANELLLRLPFILGLVSRANPLGTTVVKMRLCHHWVEIAYDSIAIFVKLHTDHLLGNLVQVLGKQVYLLRSLDLIIVRRIYWH